MPDNFSQSNSLAGVPQTAFSLRPFKREDRQPEYDRPTAFRLGPGNVRCFQPSRSLRPRNKSRSLILIPAPRVKSGTGRRDQLAAPLIAPLPAGHFTEILNELAKRYARKSYFSKLLFRTRMRRIK